MDGVCEIVPIFVAKKRLLCLMGVLNKREQNNGQRQI
jgi:hypothetical protein